MHPLKGAHSKVAGDLKGGWPPTAVLHGPEQTRGRRTRENIASGEAACNILFIFPEGCVQGYHNSSKRAVKKRKVGGSYTMRRPFTRSRRFHTPSTPSTTTSMWLRVYTRRGMVMRTSSSLG